MAAESILTGPKPNITQRSRYVVTHLHALTNDPTEYQLFTPYGFRDIAQEGFKVQGHCSKVKGQIRSHHDVAHLHPQPISRVSTSYTLQFQRYSPGKILKDKVTIVS